MERRNARGRRVVVTGLGLVTPVGNEVESTWRALLNGENGIGTITAFEATEDFDVRIAGEVKDFRPEEYMERKEVRRTDR